MACKYSIVTQYYHVHMVKLVCQFSLPVKTVIFGFCGTARHPFLPAETVVHDKWLAETHLRKPFYLQKEARACDLSLQKPNMSLDRK